MGDKVIDGHLAAILVGTEADTDGAGGGVTVPGDEHVGDLLVAGDGDLGPHPVICAVDLGADADGLEFGGNAFEILDMAVGDGDERDLYRREPGREGTREVLDQDAEEALDAAEQRAVDHHRAMALRV